MRRVLVVDDEHLIADTLTLILSRHGYEALAAYTGEEAISAAAAYKPNAVLSDVMMPGINGIQAAIRIAEDCPQCRVLLFSGQPGTAELLHEATARGYSFRLLLKPIHPQALLKALEEAFKDEE
jgi:CheY-like chemotaxis protein